MEYRTLGSLEVVRDDHPIDIGGPRQQIVLALLLLEAGRVVSNDRLVDAVWNENPPATARSQIHICVSSLRRTLATDGESSPITTRKPGYMLTLGDDRLDLHTFVDLAGKGRLRAAGGEPESAVELFRAALALWRGTAFAGPAATSPVIGDHAIRLEEHRFAVHGDCIELELMLGRHVQLIGELRGEIKRDPMRESLRAQLMTALYRAGRQADALREYRIAREMWVAELGIEPSDELCRLEQRILRGEPGLDLVPPSVVVTAPDPPGRTPVVPRLLPAPVADFTGREDEAGRLMEHLSRSQDPNDFSVPVALVTGPGGVGKSSLLLHAAHRLAGTYPDGQLYADLHDARGAGVVSRILERFLKALGHPGNAMPEDTDERAELYRNLLADRRVLICLDDVRAEGQITTLMPGGAGCAVIATSRRRLTAVPGALHVPLGAFRPEESIRLLTQVAGQDRIAADTVGARALALALGNLPLAVRIAAARLAARPHWQLSTLADRLNDETTQLNELQHGELAVRASMSLTYVNLSDAARELFQLLSLLDSPDFDSWVAAPLLARPEHDVHEVLEELVDMHLIDTRPMGSRLRYRFHNLIRAFAREQAVREVPTDVREAALVRALGALLHLCGTAHSRAYGGNHLMLGGTAQRHPPAPEVVESLVADPFAFHDREHAMVVAGVSQAAALGEFAIAWELALCAVTGFEAHFRLQDWSDTHDVALAATRQHGDKPGEAAMLYSKGSLRLLEQRLPEADELLNAAQQIFTRIGSRKGTALVLRNQAYMDQLSGRAELARDRNITALEIFRDLGDPVGQASTMRNLAKIALDEQHYEHALVLLDEATEICRDLGNLRMSAQVLHQLGETLTQTGNLERADMIFGQVIDLVRTTHDHVGEAYALLGAAQVALRRSDHSGALRILRRAGPLALETGEQRIQGRIDMTLGEVLMASGKHDEALSLLRRAAAQFRTLSAPAYEMRALELVRKAEEQAGWLQPNGRPTR